VKKKGPRAEDVVGPTLKRPVGQTGGAVSRKGKRVNQGTLGRQVEPLKRTAAPARTSGRQGGEKPDRPGALGGDHRKK